MLATTAAGLSVATSGCLREVRSAINRDRFEQLSIDITVMPADGDHQAIQVARRLTDNLGAVGIDSSFRFRSTEEFFRDTLVNHDFDCFVGRHPGGADPDFLYEALYSSYAEQSGWQNPFGVADPRLDDLLETQRRATEAAREDAVVSVLEYLAVEQPFVPICRMADLRLRRTDRFDGWHDAALDSRLGYLDLEVADAEDAELRGTVIYPSTSENLNPLSVEYRSQELFVELLYDSLATVEPSAEDDPSSVGEDGLLPWLASDWAWDPAADSEAVEDPDAEIGRLEVTIREDHAFHDGEPVMADDVVFTYELLADTRLGGDEVPTPAPRYRGRTSAVEAVEAVDDHTIEFTIDGAEAVALQALLVPILPEHVWTDRTGEPTVPGVRLAQGTTEAVVTDNVPPIGSGPFAFDDVAVRDSLELVAYDDHFTQREDVDLPGVTVDSLRAQIDPRSPSAIAFLEAGDADVTFSPLEAYAIDDIEASEPLELVDVPTTAFYTLGFNVRREPFSNPFFRQAVARLLDKAWLVEEVFQGYAEPIATPLTDAWTPEAFAFEDADPSVPFAGDAGTGTLDLEAARDWFRDAGYRFDDGHLVVRR